MRYYKYIITGRHYTKDQLKEFFNLFSNVVTPGPVLIFEDALDQLVKEEWLIVEDIDEESSAITYLNAGMKLHAVKRYRDIHNCTLKEAKRMVELIEEDIAAIRKGEKRPWQV